MPRRRGPSPSPMSRAPARSSLPARPPPSMPANPPPAQPKQPGLMGQMAATAGGVAVGSVVGHAITGALSGGSGGGGSQAVEASPTQYQQNPCQYHIDELVRCAQNQSDLTLCTGFSEALKECSRNYGLMSGR